MCDKPSILPPGQIELLMRVYFDPSVKDVNVNDHARTRLTNLGLILTKPNGLLETTEKGSTHVLTLMQTPLPIQMWTAQ